MTGHVVTLPSASPHRTLRLVTDVDLPPGHHDRQREAEPTHNRVRAAGITRGVPPVPGSVRGGQEGHRAGGRDREVDGVGGEAVREFCEAVLVRLALMGRWGPGSKEGRVFDGP
jgi:hypothetical protein